MWVGKTATVLLVVCALTLMFTPGRSHAALVSPAALKITARAVRDTFSLDGFGSSVAGAILGGFHGETFSAVTGGAFLGTRATLHYNVIKHTYLYLRYGN